MQSRIFDFYFTENHREFRSRCRKFAEKEIEPNAADWERRGEFDRTLYSKAAAAGILAPSFSRELGGMGGDLFHSIVVTEELILRGGCPGAVVGLGSLDLALPPILALGTEEQKKKWITPVIQGRSISSLALTEPGGGRDLANLKTRAVHHSPH